MILTTKRRVFSDLFLYSPLSSISNFTHRHRFLVICLNHEVLPLLDFSGLSGKMDCKVSVPVLWNVSIQLAQSAVHTDHRRWTTSCSYFTIMDFELRSQSQKMTYFMFICSFSYLFLTELLWPFFSIISTHPHIHLQAPITATSPYLFTE